MEYAPDKMKKRILLLLCVIICALTSCETISRKDNEMLSNRDFPHGGKVGSFIPYIGELGDYLDWNFYYYDGLQNPFQKGISVSYILDVDYEDENYIYQKEEVLNYYTFLEEIVIDERSKWCLMPAIELQINDYEVKIANGESYTLFPKYWGAIAFNESKLRIRYYYFWEDSMDLISNKDRLKSLIVNNSATDW